MGKRTIVRAKKELLEAGLIEKMPRYRKKFWAELVLVMAESDLPDAVWSTDAIRFCRRKFKFFPSAAELCEALSEYAEHLHQM